MRIFAFHVFRDLAGFSFSPFFFTSTYHLLSPFATPNFFQTRRSATALQSRCLCTSKISRSFPFIAFARIFALTRAAHAETSNENTTSHNVRPESSSAQQEYDPASCTAKISLPPSSIILARAPVLTHTQNTLKHTMKIPLHLTYARQARPPNLSNGWWTTNHQTHA
eukprot:TRINITY_DN1678_c0_g1_i1.p1 TRINITY_DN1678_c0_g1~~TRINITY_DN1678_c0_g1_i1.p1  ORF type:complete len:167 (+),score=6.29 TRINITY_DN1678_c0_g1_i1:463-963(+)